MEQIDVTTWADFASAITGVRTKYDTIARELPDGRTYLQPNGILFRGQANDSWPLQTTLERRTSRRMHVGRYMLAVNHSINELESFTGKRWDIKTYPELCKEIKKTQDSFRVWLPCYEYLVYLRHHGFPSPLLDWTTSPYIAAYFAYCDGVKTDRVAVYAYVATTTGLRGERAGDPKISVQGPYATTHARHFAQKAWYTIATEWSEEAGHHYFCPHDKVFSQGNTRQDVLVKISLPATERLTVLRELDDYNINHFTLFQSEDALVRTMGIKQFDMAENEPPIK